ncbi:MAG: DUF3471 domain-containing protein [Alphaproteobacteria bacterium]|nr:DUF3471 domain-containing protein [Alphaproteobacteria bacterium]MDE2493743.1 DUF3471 domain-containing protein [Alphaproteobacteria bacterium]
MIVAVLDHIWQSTLFAACVGLLTLVLHNNGARTRYWLWFAASLKFLVPFSVLILLGSAVAPVQAPSIIAEPSATVVVRQIALPFSHAVPISVVPTPVPQWDWAAALLVVWALGFVLVLAMWGIRFFKLASAVGSAADLPLKAPVPVKASPSFLEPGLVGIFRPVLLLPEGILTRLSAQEMNGIMAHELCHLRNRDNLTAAIHMLIEAVFWFYPLTWWLGARLIAERERACDEAVMECGSDPEVYAEGILKVCKFYIHSPLACAAGISGADLKKRMETIMMNKIATRLNTAKKFLLGTTAFVVVALPLAAGMIAVRPAAALAQNATQPAPTPDVIARRLAEQQQPRKIAPFDPKLFDNYAGYYELSPGAVFILTRDGNHYFAQLTGQPKIEIYPESGTKFFYTVVAAQLSFVTDAQGKATGLVLHQNGLEQPAKRISETEAKALEAALQQRIMNNAPSPGTEAFIRHHIEAMEKGKPDYSGMTPALAAAARDQNAQASQLIRKLGAFQSIKFVKVSPQGVDVYDVTFEHGQTEWYISPLGPDGKVGRLFFRPIP